MSTKFKLVTVIACIIIILVSYKGYQNKLEKISEESGEAITLEKENEKVLQGKKIELIDELLIKVERPEFLEEHFINNENSLVENLRNNERQTLLFLGDSTTEQNKYTNGGAGHVKIIENELSSIFDKNIDVYNSGKSGDTAEDMLNRVESDVLSKNPDYIIISTGINDAMNTIPVLEFKESITTIVESIKNTSTAQVIIRTSNPTRNKNVNDYIEEIINPTLKEVSEEFSTGFIDTYSIIEQRMENAEYDRDDLMYDDIHPNEKGQQEISEMIIYAMLS